jgi:hypothetical protein
VGIADGACYSNLSSVVVRSTQDQRPARLPICARTWTHVSASFIVSEFMTLNGPIRFLSVPMNVMTSSHVLQMCIL